MNVNSKDRISEMMRQEKKNGRVYARCLVTRNGVRKEVHLGVWGTASAQEAYRRLCAEFYSGVLSQDVPESGSVSIAELFCFYLQDAEERLGKPDLSCARRIMRIIAERYADLPVDGVTPRIYRTIQNELVRMAENPPPTPEVAKTRPWSRQYVNRLMKMFRSILAWGISYDLVPPDIVARLKYVPVIKEGHSAGAYEREKRQDVPDEVVRQTLPFLSPVVADMVRIQRGASMRPGEVCNLRVGDLDRRGEVWKVATRKHKTARTGVTRFFAFCPEETAILRRHCQNKGFDEFVFSPRDAQAVRWAEMRAARKTPVQPSQVQRQKEAEANKLLRFNECYTSHAYNRAIHYGLQKAARAGVQILHWTPYQLRHTAITENSDRYDSERAGKIAGHTSRKTTDVYDHSARKIATLAATEREAWW